MVHDRLVSLHGLRIKSKKKKDTEIMGRKENDRSSNDVTVLLLLSSLSFLSIFGRVTRCNDVRGVCRVSSRTQH